ncbi:MAG TPA: lactonase family protein [Polyangiaceae bacterium]|nr:lactonase family protein [Polyangiaceae bacterium]
MSTAKTVYVGCGDWSGETGRIQVFALDAERVQLQLSQELPAGGVAAFMARSADGRHLYVADETKGFLTAYAIDPRTGQLTLKNQVSTAGRPVYVALDRTGKSLTTCFFEEGRTQVFALEADGRVGAATCLVDSGRESHCTVFDPGGRHLFVPTRGDNWIAQYRFDAATRQLSPANPATVPELPGAGPRHITFHPNGRYAYLINELTLTLSVYAFDAQQGTLSAVQREIAAAPAGTSGGSAADIHVHPSGRFLYASNRQGDQSNIAIFALDPETGRARLHGHELTRGRTPRNFGLDAEGSILIVGNQDSPNVALFRVREGGGALEYVSSQPVPPGPFFVGIY